MTDLSIMKPCKRGHSGIRNAQGACVECRKISSLKHYHTKGQSIEARTRNIVNEAMRNGINGDVRRKIEDKKFQKELDDINGT